MISAYIGLGANLGNAVQTLRQALEDLQALPLCRLCAASGLYRSAPVDAGGPDYINAVAHIQTGLDPHALLARLQAIEAAHGRQRPYPNAPRSLDLDLLLYDRLRLDTPVLSLPHPRMHLRAFVLQPLQELAPSFTLPQGSLPELLAACRDQRIERLNESG